MIKKGKGTENVDVFIRCSLFTKINRVTRRLVCQQFLKLYRAKQVYYWAIQRFKLHEHKKQRIKFSLGMLHANRQSIEFQNIMIEESREAKLRSCPQRSSILLQQIQRRQSQHAAMVSTTMVFLLMRFRLTKKQLSLCREAEYLDKISYLSFIHIHLQE